MNLETLSIIQIFVTAIGAVAYILTFRYMGNKLKIMQQTADALKGGIESQSKIIGDFEKYKSIFDIEDFTKRLELKLDNQKMELTKEYNAQSKAALDKTMEAFSKHVATSVEEAMQGWEELVNIAVNLSLKKYPDKSQKLERDSQILQWYPKNAEYLIHFIDDIFDGKIQRVDLKK